MMHYRIRFKAAPKEFIFEALKHFVLVRDVIQTIRNNFKIFQDDLQVYDYRKPTTGDGQSAQWSNFYNKKSAVG